MVKISDASSSSGGESVTNAPAPYLKCPIVIPLLIVIPAKAGIQTIIPTS